MNSPAKTFPQGLFISLEGLEGAGKSTMIKRLAIWFQEQGYDPLVVGEPGGTPYGLAARQLFLTHHHELTPEAEVGLLLTAKSQLLQTKIMPALEAGRVVLCDRYTDTLYAYQHHAKGHDRAMMEAMVTAFGCELMPDYTVLLRIDPEVSVQRSLKRKAEGGEYSNIDAAPLDFHYRLSIGMISELNARSSDCYGVINGEQEMDRVFDDMIAHVCVRMNELMTLEAA